MTDSMRYTTQNLLEKEVLVTVRKVKHANKNRKVLKIEESSKGDDLVLIMLRVGACLLRASWKLNSWGIAASPYGHCLHCLQMTTTHFLKNLRRPKLIQSS